jgi:hypothetical protein
MNSPDELEAYSIMARPASRKKILFQQSRLVHQAMRSVFYTIDSADGDNLSRSVFFALCHVARSQRNLKHRSGGAHKDPQDEERCLWESRNRARVALKADLISLKIGVFRNVGHLSYQPEFERARALTAKRQCCAFADENLLLNFVRLVFEFVDPGIPGAFAAGKDVVGSG